VLSIKIYVSISVSDAGTGMDEQTLGRAIEPFYTTKPVGQGTGLGLSMVHGLAAQSEGALSLTSVLGRGTTAVLSLPVSSETPKWPSQEAHSNALLDVGAPSTILLVDDESLVRSSIAAMLSDAGYRVVEAASAHQGLSLVKEGLAMDAVVTDYAMPGMDGAQFVDALRIIRPKIPILMITGFANVSDREARGLPRLSKPFRQAELTAKIGELLGSVTFGRRESSSNHEVH
jgi:CheY-like chemotaxis protein